jgi:GT2 family glycosyltransferase
VPGPSATVVFVCYGAPRIDHGWIPPQSPIVVVHNDRLTDPAELPPESTHLFPPSNLGFGGAINLALAHIATDRVILCNPDVTLRPNHFAQLAEAAPQEVVTVPLLDSTSRPTSVVNRYPTPASALLSAWRVGRFAPRGGGVRAVLGRFLGPWGREHVGLTNAAAGNWPLQTHWVSAAVLSLATVRLREVGGFSDKYFMYMEDVDLCHRLARAFPGMTCRVLADPGRHAVGGSERGWTGRVRVQHLRARSSLTYARSMSGYSWSVAAMGMWPIAVSLGLLSWASNR